jgi:uncharacterized protein affecting Mg2+/Co2+ transport
VEENNNNGGYKTLLDSELASSPKVFQYVYNYTVPGDAVTNQPISLQFTFTDDKGNSSSSVRDITVKGSQPIVTLVASAAEATSGTAIALHTTINSSEKNIGTARLTENINHTTTTTLDSVSWTNESATTWDFVYTVPAITKPGDEITLSVIARNNEGIERMSFVRVLVK